MKIIRYSSSNYANTKYITITISEVTRVQITILNTSRNTLTIIPVLAIHGHHTGIYEYMRSLTYEDT